MRFHFAGDFGDQNLADLAAPARPELDARATLPATLEASARAKSFRLERRPGKTVDRVPGALAPLIFAHPGIQFFASDRILARGCAQAGIRAAQRVAARRQKKSLRTVRRGAAANSSLDRVANVFNVRGRSPVSEIQLGAFPAAGKVYFPVGERVERCEESFGFRVFVRRSVRSR